MPWPKPHRNYSCQITGGATLEEAYCSNDEDDGSSQKYYCDWDGRVMEQHYSDSSCQVATWNGTLSYNPLKGDSCYCTAGVAPDDDDGDDGDTVESSCAQGYKVDASLCVMCDPGTFGRDGECILCPAGTYNLGHASISAVDCRPCMPGTFSQSGASFCTGCERGSFSPYMASECSVCEPGKFADVGSPCTMCPAGTYSGIGAYTCVACGGNEISSPGASACQKCGDEPTSQPATNPTPPTPYPTWDPTPDPTS